MIDLNPALILGMAGAISAALLAVLAFALAQAPGWRELRSFALLAAVAAVYCALGLVHVVPLPEGSLLLGERLLLAASFAYGLALVRHLAVADGRPLRSWERRVLAIGALAIGFALVPDVMIIPPIRKVRVEWFGVTYTMASGSTLALAGVAFTVGAMLRAAFERGRRWRGGWQARLPMIGTALLAAAGVSDTLASLELIPVPQLVESMTVAIVGSMGVLYAQRFIADARRLEALSTHLKEEVARGTDELLRAQTVAAEHERLAGLGRIAAGVAHEINNPTAVLLQNLERMRACIAEQGELSPELEHRIERSRAATQRIADIVRQLLDSSRGPSEAHTAAIAFRVAEVNARAIAAAKASAPDLTASSDIAPTLCVRGDPSLLEQVLINVLVNAAHAARDARGGGRAHVSATRDGERVRITVKDNGPGIPGSIRARLFEPFVTTKPVGQGTGLGLAVSRRFMLRQGGDLLVVGSGPQGTEIAIELPAADPDELLTAAPSPAPPSGRRALRILVIDDNDDFREPLALHLALAYERVDEAASVEAACAFLREGRRYDVVLCDLIMPDGGGQRWLEVCATLAPGLAERTLFVTGGSTTPEAVALTEAHRERVLLKPFPMKDLQRAIARITVTRPARELAQQD